MPTPLLNSVKTSKRERTILKTKVEEWLVANEDEIQNLTAEDFEVLRRLIVVGTVRDPRVLSPSGATACARQMTLDKLKFPKVRANSPQQIGIFLDGSWRHLKWQMVFHKMGIVESMEQFVKWGDLNWGGSIDVIAILNLPVSNRSERFIIDIKGANASRFNHIKATKRPIYSNWVQLQIYLMLHGIDYGLLWYENKNDNEICEILVKASKSFQAKARRRQKYIKKYVEAEAFPREECNPVDPSDSMARYCPQRSNCLRLPVHVIKNGEVRKIANPRKASKRHQQYDTLPLTKLQGRSGEPVPPFKRSLFRDFNSP